MSSLAHIPRQAVVRCWANAGYVDPAFRTGSPVSRMRRWMDVDVLAVRDAILNERPRVASTGVNSLKLGRGADPTLYQCWANVSIDTTFSRHFQFAGQSQADQWLSLNWLQPTNLDSAVSLNGPVSLTDLSLNLNTLLHLSQAGRYIKLIFAAIFTWILPSVCSWTRRYAY